MSPYALELATARLDALRTLIDALNEAETPDEKRRCAVAIFNAPDPCDLDDEIELEEEEEEESDAVNESENDSDVAHTSDPDRTLPADANDLPSALDALMPLASLPSSDPNSSAAHQINLRSTLSNLKSHPLTPS